MRSGVVVAGGYSTRYAETDKAVAELAGAPLIRRVVDRIADVVDKLVVNCRAEQQSAITDALGGFDPTYALDETPDRGPLAGIARGLSAATGEYALVVACDMPFVDPDFVSYLFERADGADGAVVRLDGHRQPLLAVYRREPMSRACTNALESGERRLLTALADLDCVVLEASELDRSAARSFENLNTRADLRAAAQRIETDQQ